MSVKTGNIEEIRRTLDYNKSTGVFTRRIPSRIQKVGDIAGSHVESSTKPGKFYIRVGVLGRYFLGTSTCRSLGNWAMAYT